MAAIFAIITVVFALSRSAIQFDPTNNKVVSVSDALNVAQSWEDLKEAGTRYAASLQARDIDGDQSVGVGDVQAVISHRGEVPNPVYKLSEPSATAGGLTFIINSKVTNRV